MIAYEELLEKLRENADVSFREFNAKICVLPLDRTLGVRVPALRKISKEYAALAKMNWTFFVVSPTICLR